MCLDGLHWAESRGTDGKTMLTLDQTMILSLPPRNLHFSGQKKRSHVFGENFLYVGSRKCTELAGRGLSSGLEP